MLAIISLLNVICISIVVQEIAASGFSSYCRRYTLAGLVRRCLDLLLRFAMCPAFQYQYKYNQSKERSEQITGTRVAMYNCCQALTILTVVILHFLDLLSFSHLPNTNRSSIQLAVDCFRRTQYKKKFLEKVLAISNYCYTIFHKYTLVVLIQPCQIGIHQTIPKHHLLVQLFVVHIDIEQ